MNEKLDKKLVEAFPNLYQQRYGDMRTTCMVWGFEHEDGWFQIIWDLSAKLEKIIVDHMGSMSEEQKQTFKKWYGTTCPCASQVKQKYGTLRFYMNTETTEISKAIREAEELSAKTCESCGKNGQLCVKYSWYMTLCEKCREELNYERCKNE